MSDMAFSKRLDIWRKSKQPKTLATLIETFGDKSFAVIMFLFMAFPALPLPTAGHLFEAITIIIAAGIVLGLKTIWVPQFLSSRIKLTRVVKSRAMDKLVAGVRWLELKAGPYGAGVFYAPLVKRMLGLVIIAFAVAAFLSPPFSGLDTLPSLGVVIICLSILLENIFLLITGLAVGTVGVLLSIFLGEAALKLAGRFF